MWGTIGLSTLCSTDLVFETSSMALKAKSALLHLAFSPMGLEPAGFAADHAQPDADTGDPWRERTATAGAGAAGRRLPTKKEIRLLGITLCALESAETSVREWAIGVDLMCGANDCIQLEP